MKAIVILAFVVVCLLHPSSGMECATSEDVKDLARKIQFLEISAKARHEVLMSKLAMKDEIAKFNDAVEQKISELLHRQALAEGIAEKERHKQEEDRKNFEQALKKIQDSVDKNGNILMNIWHYMVDAPGKRALCLIVALAVLSRVIPVFFLPKDLSYRRLRVIPFSLFVFAHAAVFALARQWETSFYYASKSVDPTRDPAKNAPVVSLWLHATYLVIYTVSDCYDIHFVDSLHVDRLRILVEDRVLDRVLRGFDYRFPHLAGQKGDGFLRDPLTERSEPIAKTHAAAMIIFASVIGTAAALMVTGLAFELVITKHTGVDLELPVNLFGLLSNATQVVYNTTAAVADATSLI